MILNDVLTFLALNDLCFTLIHQIKIAFVLARTNNWRLPKVIEPISIRQIMK